MPLRFGSTKRSESFHIGLVKSTIASSRPKTGLFSRWLGPQHFQSHSSSSGGDAQHLAHGEVLHVQLRQPLQGVLDRQRDEMDVGELVGQDGERAGQHADGVGLAVAQVDQVAAERPRRAMRCGSASTTLRLGDLVERLADAAGEAQAAQPQFFGGGQHRKDGSDRGRGRMLILWHAKPAAASDRGMALAQPPDPEEP